MKFVPANRMKKDQGDTKYDFLLVIDTEGLNAPELLNDETRRNRDNELATLAVGLGQDTLINLKGENIAEMKDILQIVILAFLRINASKSNKGQNIIDELKSCMFVHQNVSAVNANQKLQEGLEELLKTLDIATQEAAESESQDNITRFKDLGNSIALFELLY